MRTNELKYKILTNLGWQEFDGIEHKGQSDVYEITLDNDYKIQTTIDHQIYVDWFSSKSMKDLKIGDDILTSAGFHKIVSKEYIGKKDVYDILNVGVNNRFYANNILVHNCEFIGKSNTLVSSEYMKKLISETKDKHYIYLIDNDVRMYKELDPKMKYFISLDPSMGVSGDFAAIQIMEYPTMEQVGEWQDDKLNQNDQVSKVDAIVQEMWKRLKSKGLSETNIYWSVENNSVGQGFVCALRELASQDEFCESYKKYIKHAYLISQRKKSETRDDIGFNTNKSSKTIASSQLKTMIEIDKIHINSYELVKQLSNYTKKSLSYSADKSEHDDLISALLINIMMFLQEKDSLDLTEFNIIYNKNNEITEKEVEIPFMFFSN